jgi:Ribosomal L28e protein family
MASDQLLWQILKGHNSFVRKGLNGLVLSAEPGNLYNKHSYKYSGATSASFACSGRSEAARLQQGRVRQGRTWVFRRYGANVMRCNICFHGSGGRQGQRLAQDRCQAQSKPRSSLSFDQRD